MRLLFLDIDGVLNSASSILALGPSYPTDDVGQTNLCPVATGLLARAVRECEVTHVYVHSTWAGGSCDEGYFQRLLALHGMAPQVLPIVHNAPPWGPGRSRQSRIDAGLVSSGVLVSESSDYVVLDDVDMTDHFGARMVVCDADHGFSYPQYVRVCERFDVQPMLVLI